MQTSKSRTSRKVMGLLTGERRIDARLLSPKEWIELILKTADKLRGDNVKLDKFHGFAKINEPWGYFSGSLFGTRNCNPERRTQALQTNTFPDGISINTKVLELQHLLASDLQQEVIKQDRDVYLCGDILLTDKFTFLIWTRCVKGLGYDEQILASTLRHFTVASMEEYFVRIPDMPHRIFHRLHELPALHAEELERNARMARRFAGEMNYRQYLLTAFVEKI